MGLRRRDTSVHMTVWSFFCWKNNSKSLSIRKTTKGTAYSFIPEEKKKIYILNELNRFGLLIQAKKHFFKWCLPCVLSKRHSCLNSGSAYETSIILKLGLTREFIFTASEASCHHLPLGYEYVYRSLTACQTFWMPVSLISKVGRFSETKGTKCAVYQQ